MALLQHGGGLAEPLHLDPISGVTSVWVTHTDVNSKTPPMTFAMQSMLAKTLAFPESAPMPLDMTEARKVWFTEEVARFSVPSIDAKSGGR
jgi:hypothetical protein